MPSQDSLFSPDPEPEADPQSVDDPFAKFADDIKTQVSKPKGYWQRPRDAQSLADNVQGLIDHGDPERGATGRTARKKPVDHNARSRKYLESCGYAVTRLESWRTLGSGFSCKVDYLGLWDFEGLKSGHPRMLVQVCGKTGKSAHLRKMCSDSRALDNRRPRIENLRYCLAQGWRCVLLIWTANDKGRYESEIVKITTEMVDEALARKRK